MTTIPDEIMEQARDVADRLFRRRQYRDWHVAKDPERIIALALQDAVAAAEMRGREEAAQILEARMPIYTSLSQKNAIRECISSIRSGS